MRAEFDRRRRGWLIAWRLSELSERREAALAEKTHATMLCGNVDPMALFGPEEVIRAEVERCLSAAGPWGHILNVGHGVVQVWFATA
ncbi:Uroporphyrinogen decarboxylase [Tetrabaena socialis]|uniref:Uroporphyrinogen decarboxylase n=1 Tax=Tetrabaena socialis TaxID=47790 RepID=A0A2J8AAC1_9CHLO|nr:Uroporphyrinogen decarboxylase [Tetrabaena socialis]|eukprot:PNH09455.1 Uroporphyrinogen decarboxylase [Tetrabaena socialis]